MGLGFNKSSAEKLNRLRLYECDQSAWVLKRQATSRTYDNAGGPVPRLTIHNPLLAVSVTSGLAGACFMYPSLFVNYEEQVRATSL